MISKFNHVRVIKNTSLHKILVHIKYRYHYLEHFCDMLSIEQSKKKLFYVSVVRN
jgi:hypothetical protein